MLGWLSRLLARREAAKLALEILDRVWDEAEEASELARRLRREADKKDLEDSLQRFAVLRRQEKSAKG